MQTYPDIAALKKHSAVHGERHHACPVDGCGKKFLDNSKLKRHMLVHSGERTDSIAPGKVRTSTREAEGGCSHALASVTW